MQQYDAVAEQYEGWIVPKYAVIARLIVEAAEPVSGEHALEVGAGTGGLSRLVAPRLGPDGSLTVTDISSGMLALAQRVLGPGGGDGPALTFLEADLAALPVPDGRFDLVLSQFTPLLDSPAGLGEAARVLRQGGRLTAATWGTGYSENVLLNAARADAGVAPYPVPEPETITARLRAAGFDRITQRTVTLDVAHDSVDAYLAYRAGFGIPFVARASEVDAYQAALRHRVDALASPDGQVRLDWSIVLVTALRQ